MKILFCCACLGLLLFTAAPARAQMVPVQSPLATEPPVKVVPQAERKSKPERVDDNTPVRAGGEPSARGSRPERSARGNQGRPAGAGRGARGAGAGGTGRPAGAGRGH